ncbi:MAG: hypothetical protein U9N45_06700 [Gemmatimonadota bacterium]|nr:hypothetical protein [Gemmatimonadota bacterium]
MEKENDTQLLNEEPAEGAPENVGPDGKALKKTYHEIREEARRSILSGHDREKFEGLDSEEREFVDAACLFEFNSQKVGRKKRKVKLREMLLCRDVAAAYCSGKDIVGQYSEGMRILKNSESGSETVKFVMARKVCSMLEKIHNLYSSHPRSYVSADLHRAETQLLNYSNRLGKIIRNPLSEAKRIYNKLKERTGWEIPSSAFNNAEGCDVPQLFFTRYSDASQLLLKDPSKPFRSDNTNPPLKLDFRIKNAVLVVAGENRFHIDKKKFQTVQHTSAAKAIAAKALKEVRDKITKDYRRNKYDLADRLRADDEINVRSIKEDSFNFFYGYTLKNLPNTAARADAAELMIAGLMHEENDLGCRGFCRNIFPPEAVQDSIEPDSWDPATTGACELRRIFHQVGTGKERLSMFPTRMNQLMAEYLDKQLHGIKEEIADPFAKKITRAEKRLKEFIEKNKARLETAEACEGLESIEQERRELIEKSLSLFNSTFRKTLRVDTDQQKEELIRKVRPKLEEEAGKRGSAIQRLKERYKAMAAKGKALNTYLEDIDNLIEKTGLNPDDPKLEETRHQLSESLARLDPENRKPETAEALRSLAAQQIEHTSAELDKIKGHCAGLLKVQKPLEQIISIIQDVDNRKEQISRLKEQRESLNPLLDEKQAFIEETDSLKDERDEALSLIEDEIEVNRET